MLKLSEEECYALLQTLWHESITGLALVDEDGSFRRANPAFCRIVEYTEAELRRLRFQDITDPADCRADEEMARLVAAGEYPGYEITKSYITKTKRHQAVLLRVTGLWLSGKFTYFVGEVAPLDSPPAERRVADDPSMRAAARRLRFLNLLKDYWVQITAFLGAAAMLAERVLNNQR